MCYSCISKLSTLFLKNNISILTQIVWETQKWHWNFSKPSRFLDYLSKCAKYCLEWSRCPTKSLASETGKFLHGKLFRRIHCSDSWIAALIGQSDGKSNYWLHSHHMNPFTSLGWIDELQAIWPILAAEYFPRFQGNWKWLFIQVSHRISVV